MMKNSKRTPNHPPPPSVLDEPDVAAIAKKPRARRAGTAPSIAAAQQQAQTNVLGQLEADHAIAMAEAAKTIEDLQKEVHDLEQTRTNLKETERRLTARNVRMDQLLSASLMLKHEVRAAWAVLATASFWNFGKVVNRARSDLLEAYDAFNRALDRYAQAAAAPSGTIPGLAGAPGDPAFAQGMAQMASNYPLGVNANQGAAMKGPAPTYAADARPDLFRKPE